MPMLMLRGFCSINIHSFRTKELVSKRPSQATSSKPIIYQDVNEILFPQNNTIRMKRVSTKLSQQHDTNQN